MNMLCTLLSSCFYYFPLHRAPLTPHPKHTRIHTFVHNYQSTLHFLTEKKTSSIYVWAKQWLFKMKTKAKFFKKYLKKNLLECCSIKTNYLEICKANKTKWAKTKRSSSSSSKFTCLEFYRYSFNFRIK